MQIIILILSHSLFKHIPKTELTAAAPGPFPQSLEQVYTMIWYVYNVWGIKYVCALLLLKEE